MDNLDDNSNSADDIFKLLDDECREDVIRYLKDSEGVFGRGEIAGYLDEKYEDRDKEDLEISLHHLHLPKLEDAGIIEYYDKQSLVTYKGDEEIESRLK